MSLFKNLTKYVKKNKWQIASMALMAYTGYSAFAANAGTTAATEVAATEGAKKIAVDGVTKEAGRQAVVNAGKEMTTTQLAALSMANSSLGAMAEEEQAENAADKAERHYNKNTTYFGINRNQDASEANLGPSSAAPRQLASRSMANSPGSLDDLISANR